MKQLPTKQPQVVYIEEEREPQQIVIVKRPSRHQLHMRKVNRAGCLMVPFGFGLLATVALIFVLPESALGWFVQRAVMALGFLFLVGSLATGVLTFWWDIKAAFESMWYGAEYYE
jgi:hypothetical protein